jgi:hypothetical protein
MGQHVEIQHEVVLPLEHPHHLLLAVCWTGYLNLWVYKLQTGEIEHCLIEENLRQLVTGDVLSVRLVPEVVQTGQTGGADGHPRAFADRVETLEHLDVLGPVIGSWLVGVSGHAEPRSLGGKTGRDQQLQWRHGG